MNSQGMCFPFVYTPRKQASKQASTLDLSFLRGKGVNHANYLVRANRLLTQV